MSEITGKRRKKYVDCPKDISKLTCFIHSPVHSSYKCEVLGDFGSKDYKSRHTKDLRQEPATKKKFGRYQDNIAIFQHAFY